MSPVWNPPLWMAKSKVALSDLYKLDISVERAWLCLCFLEVQVDCHGQHIDWEMTNKVLLSFLTDCPPTHVSL